MSDRATLLARLREALGASHVLTDGDLSAWELDWRKRWRGRALAVLRPGTPAEVQACVRLAAEHGVAIVPQGGNTGLVGGGVPDDSGRELLLSTQRLNRIRAIDTPNATLTAEAGCVLQTVQQAAREAGMLFPLSLAAEGSCTLGGNLATNAGGTQVLRYGNARDLCLGLEVVLADGSLWSGLSGLRKDNTGFALRDLMIGSEGTLGIITAATVKLFPPPRGVVTAWAALPTMAACVALLERARQALGADVTGFEVMNAQALDLVATHMPGWQRPLPAAPWSVLLEVGSAQDEAALRDAVEALLGAAIEAGEVDDCVLAASLAQRHAMWKAREDIPLAQAAEGLNIKHDISLPVSAIPGFVEDTDAALGRLLPQVRFVDFGHLGDGNLHYNVQAPAGVDAAAFLARHEEAVNRVVYDAVMQAGGSISAEHGIGILKRDELAERKDPAALAAMRAIKAALDPRGTLNPGRVV